MIMWSLVRLHETTPDKLFVHTSLSPDSIICYQHKLGSKWQVMYCACPASRTLRFIYCWLWGLLKRNTCHKDTGPLFYITGTLQYMTLHFLVNTTDQVPVIIFITTVKQSLTFQTSINTTIYMYIIIGIYLALHVFGCVRCVPRHIKPR